MDQEEVWIPQRFSKSLLVQVRSLPLPWPKLSLATVLKIDVIEPFGSVKYTQEDGGYNRVNMQEVDGLIGPQKAEADKVIKAVLDKVGK